MSVTLPTKSGTISLIFRAEARWLRALGYWHALDLFGNVPFVTEDAEIGDFFPPQIQRADLFSYIESELRNLKTGLWMQGQMNMDGPTKEQTWMLLAKLYLNAEIYIGSAKNI